MPIFEYACVFDGCARRGQVEEMYFPRYFEPGSGQDPTCDGCGEKKNRLISQTHAIWTKSLAEMGDKGRETYWQDLKRGGHVVARKRSGGGTAENPVFELIRTRQDQLRYCREEGMSDPTDFGSVQVSQDGKSFSSGVGERGCWV